MASKQSKGLRPTRREIACEDLEPLYPAFGEGSLGIELARKVREHIDTCPSCRETVLGFRALLATTSATDVVPFRSNQVVSEMSTHLSRWTALLKSWLDMLYPGSVPAHAFRGGNVRASADRDTAARRRSEKPFLVGRDDRMQIVVHRARGQLLGRVDDLSGLPMFPVLIVLENSRNPVHILNRLDGTFNTDWDPDATGIVCWTPTGGKSFFAFNAR